jgi:transglutaminase-like putative cysteine protease
MIALCRDVGLPARYVAGHTLDEGVMHAWEEVVMGVGDSRKVRQTLDPTHNRRAGIPSVTVAIERDFADSSPTRATLHAPHTGHPRSGAHALGCAGARSVALRQLQCARQRQERFSTTAHVTRWKCGGTLRETAC